MALKEEIILPEILKKLEIVSDENKTVMELLPGCRTLQSTMQNNPFIVNTTNELLVNETKDENLIKIFGPTCEDCNRIHKRENVNIQNTNNSHNNNNTTNKLENLIKNVTFKTKNTKKSILKKPIIKYFGSCSNHNHYKIIKNENNLNKIFGENNNTLIDDDNFKTLANKYSSLSLDSHHHHNYNNSNSNSEITDRLNCNNLFVNNTNTINVSNHKQYDNFGNNNNATTSCSQQARINVRDITTSCDITIDELASYFETFVHIPKKMSTMAEMMYI